MTATRKIAASAGPKRPVALMLVSHPLCPYVQRAAIVLAEKRLAFRRVDIDLADKPDWFRALSPLGKTPVLTVGGRPIFESAVILEYLEETTARPLHPKEPLKRAQHRGWIEFASAVLNDIAGLYNAQDAAAFAAKAATLQAGFVLLEDELGTGPYFAGRRFTFVDAAFAPVFRYFDVFDTIGDFAVLDGLPRIASWRKVLAARPSVRGAVPADYPERLRGFLARRGSHLTRMMVRAAA